MFFFQRIGLTWPGPHEYNADSAIQFMEIIHRYSQLFIYHAYLLNKNVTKIFHVPGY